MSAPLNDFDVKVGAVFHWNAQDRTHRIKINPGGTSSGKTYNILLVILSRLFEKTCHATVVGATLPALRTGAMRDWTERILVDYPELQKTIVKVNLTERKWTFTNGSTLEFLAFKDGLSARQGKRNIAFLTEANSIAWEIFFQINARSDEVFIDFNPTAPFWAHDKLMHRDDAITFISNWTHNPFASAQAVAEIKRMATDDPESYKVYGLGKTGKVGGLIHPTITIVPTFPKNCRNVGYGMDLGYTNSPTTLVKGGLLNERDLYLDQMIYQRRLGKEQIGLLLKLLRIPRYQRIIADSSSPETIDHLEEGGWRVEGAAKGPGSVNDSITLLNYYNLHVTERSVEMIEEQKRYRWAVQRTGDYAGRLTNKPVKAFDHCWDAAKYYATGHLTIPRDIDNPENPRHTGTRAVLLD